MTHTVLWRVLEGPDELILAGDQFKMKHADDSQWAPCEILVGHRLKDLDGSRTVVRRQIMHTPTVKEENVPAL